MYRCLATSLDAFVQQAAVSYIGNGYYFYVAGRVPKKKDPAAVDRKLIEKYEIDITKFARSRRKQGGRANMQYIRLGARWFLMATHGTHRFYEEEAGQIRDVRRVPLKIEGYSISYRGGHSSVRIDQTTYLELKAYFLDHAPHWPLERLEGEFRAIRFRPYAPVRRQMLNILRATNKVRKQAGRAPVDFDTLPLKRRPLSGQLVVESMLAEPVVGRKMLMS